MLRQASGTSTAGAVPGGVAVGTMRTLDEGTGNLTNFIIFIKRIKLRIISYYIHIMSNVNPGLINP
jgi:hypothetical protein